LLIQNKKINNPYAYHMLCGTEEERKISAHFFCDGTTKPSLM